MDILLDAAFTPMARREPLASAMAARDQGPQAGAGTVTPAAVAAMAAGEKPKTTADDERGDDKTKQHAPQPAAQPDAAGTVELQFNYERELNRIFIDLVGKQTGDERLMRMPPEQFARYVEQIKAETETAADQSPRLDAIA